MKKNTGNPNLLWEKAVAIHRGYWTFDEKEKIMLLQKYDTEELSYEEIYRLHHLICLEIHETNMEEGLSIYKGELKELSLQIRNDL